MSNQQGAAVIQEPRVADDKDNKELSGQSCPIGSKMVTWEFECTQCEFRFETPAPRGPKEERAMKCPQCNGRDIKRINIGKLQEIACGG